MGEVNARTRFGSGAGATAEEVKERWRTLRSQLHPDKGGSADSFARHKRLYMAALREAKNVKEYCKHCEDRGIITQHFGTRGLMIKCPHCLGG